MTRATVRTRWGARPIAAALSLSMLFAGPGSAAVVDEQAKQPAEARSEVEAIEIQPDLSAPPEAAAPAVAREPMSAECEALANSALAAPEWYAERCGGGAVPELLAPPVDTSFVPGDTAVLCSLFSPNGALARRLLTAPLPTSTYTNVGPCSVAPASIFAMDYDNTATTLWAIDSQCGASCTGTTYGTINAATGAFTAVGNITGSPVGSNFAGMKFDPTDGQVYIATIAGGASQLRRLDLATGVSTQIGGNIAGLIIDIAISNTGVIYGHDISLDRIVTIDKTTGATTVVGPTGIDANFAQGMDFDASDNTLYLFAITIPGNVGRIGSVNLATGAFTTLSTNGEELEGAIRVPTTPPVAPDIFIDEVEPNDTSANAQVLPSTPARVRGYLYRAPFVAGQTDVDVFSFTAGAGDRVSAAVMTSWSSGSLDSELDILDVDGTTVLETDDDNGTVGSTSSNIGGRLLPAAGTYYVRVRQGSITAIGGTIRPYDLYVDVQSGTPVAEVEPNENSGQANPLPASGWVSGVVDPAADADVFSLNVNAGDTIIATLDGDPERDAIFANLRIGIGNFNNFILVTGDTPPAGDAPSEALMMTVKDTGPHFVYVLEQVAGVGAPTATYNLSVRVIPAKTRTCTTYTGTGGPIADIGITDFTIAVPDAGRIGYVRLALNATHSDTADLDVTLIGPEGNEVFLFDDLTNNATSAAPQINTVFEDEAGIPVGIFTIYSGPRFIPENGGRLEYFNGTEKQGTWTLRVRDDLATDVGTVNSWSLDVCEPAPRPACLTPGPAENTIFTTDFEAGDAGFTHSGTADEWERGLPSFPPITTAHSGVNAWATDLDNTYDASSNQNLLSPPIDLTAATGRITLNWWQKYNIESATFDRYWVEVQQVGLPATARRVFEWRGATMRRTLGSPGVVVEQAAGWAPVQADISGFAGSNVEVIFHLETDASVQLTGVAVDDVLVTSCTQVQGQTIADAAISKTDGQTTYFPGQVLTYTIVASNLGPAAIVGANVVDNFPAELTGVSWTCVASAGSSCGGASGTGDINAIVDLLNGGTATFTATATVSATATGPIANTATITVPTTTADPVLANNSATDTNTFLLVTVEPAALAVDTAGNNVYEPNETVVMEPSWRNTSAAAVALAGALANHTGPAGATYTIPDGAASYGTIAAGATASCTAGANCYSVANAMTARPLTHWDSTADETVTPSAAAKTWTLHIGNSFTDVALASPFYRFIETILHKNVTGGCTPTTYCPASSTTREQMAVFVLVAKEPPGYAPPACGATPMFADVPVTSPFCRWVEELANRGVVAGCGGGNYCPGSPTTREQMAVFVLRTLDPALNPPNCPTPSMFADVPASSPFCKWVEELARRGVVTGCGGGNYCPAFDVTREQMGVFLAVTFGLTLYGL